MYTGIIFMSMSMGAMLVVETLRGRSMSQEWNSQYHM